MRDAITVGTINHRVVDAEYAVRGPIVARAQQLERALRDGEKLPFDKVVYCNIGNPHSLGQRPISFFRQVLAAICLLYTSPSPRD